MNHRTIAATLTLALFSTLGMGCDFVDGLVNGEAAASQGSGEPTIDTACSNLETLVGEPAARCKNEMGAFLGQCSEQSQEVLACMTTATSPDAIQACTQPCMMAAADEMAPPVPPERDTPALAAACKASTEAAGKVTPAETEACKRLLAQEVSRCPEIETEVLECYATAVKSPNPDAPTDCLMRCLEDQIRASQAEEKGKNKGKKKRKGKNERKGKNKRKGKKNQRG